MRYLILILLLPLAAIAQDSADYRYQGRVVSEVIDDLRAGGTNIAYSTNLVSEDLVVQSEPSSDDPLAILSQILRPHGLMVKTEAGVHLVVRFDQDGHSPGTVQLKITTGAGAMLGSDPNVSVEPALPVPARLAVGQYEYRQVSPGLYKFNVEVEGFDPASRTVQVWPGETAIVSFSMDVQEAEIETLAVSASRYEIARDISASRFVLDQRTIQNMPDIGEDPVRVVQRLPGAAASGASAKTHFRGGETSEIGIMLNGMRLFDPFHVRDYQSIFSTIDSRAIEGVEVYTGGFPVQYGNRMSGMVLMESLQTVEQRRTEVGISVFDTSILHAGHEADKSWVISARRGNLDLVLKPEFGSPNYFDVFGDYTWRLTPDTTVSVNGLYAEDRVEIILESEPDELERVVSNTRNLQFWVNMRTEWTDSLSSSTILSATSFDNFRRGSLNDEEKIVATVFDDREVTEYGFRQHFSFTKSEKHHLQWGLSVKYAEAEFDYRNEAEYFGLPALIIGQEESSETVVVASPNGAAYALYLSDRWRITDKSTIEWGLRWDDQTYTNAASDAQLSPRLSFMQVLGDNTELRLSWGRYHQAQELNELQVEDGIDQYWPAQRADHVIAGIRHTFADQYALRVEAFYKDIQQVRPRFENLYDPLGLIPEVQADRVRLEPASAQSHGLEVSIDRFEGPFNWWATYVLSEATDRIDGRDELRSWDQRHAVQAGFSWGNDHWDVSVAGSVHTGWPLTELALVETGVDPDGEIEYVAIPGPRNVGRHATFASLDFRVSRTWQVGNSSLMAFVEVSNATNRQNECCLDFDVEEDEDTGELELERGVDYWLPLLPAIGVRWQF